MGDAVTLDDIEKSRTRRRWLKGLAALGSVGGLGWFLFTDTDARPTSVSVALAPGVESLSWEGDVLTVAISSDTRADQWFVLHESEEQPTAAVASGDVSPGQKITLQAGELRASRYDTKRYKFLLVDVGTGEKEFSYDAERVGSVEFSLP